MARILGLDLGAHRVKAVVLDTNLRGYTVAGFQEVPVTPVPGAEGDRMGAWRVALAQLLSQPLRADQVAVSLPGLAAATHLITLPFVDSKRIEATLPFEIESQLPFDLSEAVFDYQLAGQKDGKSDLLVGVARKEELSNLLALLGELRLDPRIVTHPGIAYQQLLKGPASADLNPEDALAIVDLGHERVTVAIGRAHGQIELARTFAGGGKDLTRALAAELQVGFDEAQRMKEEAGLGPMAHGPEGQRAAAALVRGLQPTLRELRPTLKAYTARMRTPLSRVLLCGGTAALPGLDAQLSNDLGLPTQVLALPPETADTIPLSAQTSAAQAIALGLRAQLTGAKAPRFNLRRGENVFKGDFDYLKDKLGRLAAFAAVLITLLIASSIMRNTMLRNREKAVDKALCQITQRVLGQCETNFDRALNLMKGKESPAAALPKVSAVTLLAELTQRLPEGVPIQIEQIVIDSDRISARCETDTFERLDAITSALKTYPCFKDVQEPKAEKTKDGVQFRLEVQVDCPDTQSAPQG